MAYRLPSAWDPGYAMPKNALDEGLERRAFVTKWQPRGSYDNPRFENRGGYALPGYVRQEPYGQEAKVTDWQPGGTYNGPKIPHWLNQRTRIVDVAPAAGGGKRVTIARHGLGDTGPVPIDDAFPEPWGTYGRNAAAAIMSRVAAIPGPRKKTELKKFLDKIDPSLWHRTAELTRRYIKRGAAPPAALQAALARAMSAGVVAELHKTGKTGKYPSKGQLGGMGNVSSRSALGVVVAPGARPTTTSTTSVATDIGGPHYADGTCTPDGRLIWSAGQWRVKAPDDVCVATAPVTTAQVLSSLAAGSRPIYVGPFPLDLKNGSGQITTLVQPAAIPKSWGPWFAHAATVAAQALTDKGRTISIAPWPNRSGWMTDGASGWITDGAGAVEMRSNKPASYWTAKASGGHPLWPSAIVAGVDGKGRPTHHTTYAGDPNTYDYYSVFDWLASIDPALAMAYPLGMLDLTNALTAANTTEYNPPFNLAPIAKFTHPGTGETWGLWIAIVATGGGVEGRWNTSTDAPDGFVMQVGLAPMPQEPWYASILDALLWLPGLVGDLLGDLGGLLGDLLCTAASSVNANRGAATAAGPYGAAAAGGAAIVGAACSGGQPPPPPPTSTSSSFLPLAIAGGALAAVYLVTRKKKPKASP